MKSRQEQVLRRMKYLASILPMPYPFSEEMVAYLRGDTDVWPSDVNPEYNCLGAPSKRKSLKRYRELFQLMKEFGVKIFDVKAVRVWAEEFWWLQPSKISRQDYSAMPKPLRKDNKTYVNRTSGPSSNYSYHHPHDKVRFPKKKRKTAWKRFYRLFPNLKNNQRDATAR